MAMAPELALRRRVLLRAYRRFLAADRAWQRGVAAAAEWFPRWPESRLMTLGDPGSRVRRLYDARTRALAQLQGARDRLRNAEARLARRRARTVLLLPVGR